MRFKIMTAMATVAVLAAAGALAQGPYAGQQARAVKALSAEETRDLLEGRGMGLAKAAELNHYPGPAHLLQLAKELDLSAADTDSIRQAFATMDREAKIVGMEIIAIEGELDALFASGKADTASVAALTAKIGALQGRLRAVHLNAHLAVRPKLSAKIIARYDALRGYAGGNEHRGHGGGSGH